jgi:hypothetical protein
MKVRAREEEVEGGGKPAGYGRKSSSSTVNTSKKKEKKMEWRGEDSQIASFLVILRGPVPVAAQKIKNFEKTYARGINLPPPPFG